MIAGHYLKYAANEDDAELTPKAAIDLQALRQKCASLPSNFWFRWSKMRFFMFLGEATGDY